MLLAIEMNGEVLVMRDARTGQHVRGHPRCVGAFAFGVRAEHSSDLRKSVQVLTQWRPGLTEPFQSRGYVRARFLFQTRALLVGAATVLAGAVRPIVPVGTRAWRLMK